MSESYFERFRRTFDRMEFDTLPLFSRPHFSWSLTTDYVGRRLQYRPHTESTQEDARRVIERWRFGHGGIVLAEREIAAPDVEGSEAYSPPDVNLYFTLVLSLNDAGADELVFVPPLAIAEAIEHTVATREARLEVGITWPADLEVAGKQIARVAIDSTVSPEGEPLALIGVVVNVNLELSANPGPAQKATSLKQELGFDVSREELLAAFCNRIEALWEGAKSGASSFEAWKSRLTTLGSDVPVPGERGLRGRAVDVEADGSLVLEAGGERIVLRPQDVPRDAR